MIKLFVCLIFFIFLLPQKVFALESSFVSVVNPVRGEDFWEITNQQPETAVAGQMEILKKFNLPSTWLLRFDALDNKNIVDLLSASETGLFLEVTPAWAKASGVSYHQSENWHNAGSAFLTGYEREEREKLIDSAFEQFKKVFGEFPVSVGAWWIDSYSLDYMQKKYGIKASLIVSDQYSTDNYQVWGQYFGTPYYPSKKNALHPAQTLENKLPVVMAQWAPRDPVNGYGSSVLQSTYSLQANDYLDYQGLNTKYFSTLLDLYTKQVFNSFSHVVVGLENSYSWEKYQIEYQNQMQVLSQKRKDGKFSVLTLRDFASWYKNRFPNLSPPQIIIADDPLGSLNKSVWFMNPYYRAGWFFNKDGSLFRDIRQYIDGEEELCFLSRCDSVNFATSTTRVLDEVSFGHKWIIDEGKISQFKVTKDRENFILSYQNEAGNLRKIEFMPRDISVDGKISSIDGVILEAIQKDLNQQKIQNTLPEGQFKWFLPDVLVKTLKFMAFMFFGCFIPGLFVSQKIANKAAFLQKIFLSLAFGFVVVTLLFYILSLVNFKQGIFIYLLINFFLLLKNWKTLSYSFQIDVLPTVLILIGTVFQQLPTFKNGLHFPYGLGFWGPNTHDGLWHVALINQLVKSVPPQNPIFSGEILKNYHFFYDLLIAATSFISDIPVLDLVFRFYPIVFSILLGLGTYCLVKYFFRVRELPAILSSLYLVYFAGSFGWIVEYIKFKHLGGESAFWANQAISFNLNPPFAISLLLVIGILLSLSSLKSFVSAVVVSILAGSLIAFKAYGGVLILASLIVVGILKRNLYFLATFLVSLLLSLSLFLSNFTLGQQLMIFSPFWFIHAMIDSPDRVGWTRLTLARMAGLEQGNWFKFLTAEAVGFLIFFVGNMGTRVFVLLHLSKIKNIVRHQDYLFVFVFSSLALAIPLLFIQAGNPWNTIQFIYYFIYISGVLAGIVFWRTGIILVAIIVLITPINSWATANGYLTSKPHAFISNQELEALNFLKSQPDGVVLTYPFDEKLKNKIAEPWPVLAYETTAYVAALSEKATFVEDEIQNNILLTDYKKRVVAAKDFFTRPSDIKFLKENNIKYIYLPKIFNLSLADMKIIFENNEVVIYEIS